MNHQRFKFYKHSTEYYRSLLNTINELEQLDVTPCITHPIWVALIVNLICIILDWEWYANRSPHIDTVLHSINIYWHASSANFVIICINMTRWGAVSPGCDANRLLKFMLFFGIEPVYAVLLLFFCLFDIIYHRPSV